MPTKRTHLYVPLVNEAGDLLRYSKVQLYLPDGKTLYTGKIYRDRVGVQTYTNPWIVSPALVSVWLPGPMRLRIGVAPDQSKPEILTDVYDVQFDGAESVSTTSPVFIGGTSTPLALLSATDANNAFWHPLKVDHEHEGVAPSTMRAGRSPVRLRQAGTYPSNTTLGADAGGDGAHSSLRMGSMLGLSTDAYGRATIAVGASAVAEEGPEAAVPTQGRTLTLGPGPIYADGSNPASTAAFTGTLGPSGQPVFRMARVAGTAAGWGSYLAANIDRSVPKGVRIDVTLWFRSSDGACAPKIVSDPDTQQVLPQQVVNYGDQVWHKITFSGTTENVWTPGTQRLRTALPTADTGWMEWSDPQLTVWFPFVGGAASVGASAASRTESASLGAQSSAEAAGALAAGRTARSDVDYGVALGVGAAPDTRGVAIGLGTGSLSNGPAGSVGVGAGAQYGLPSDDVNPTVLLGAFDPAQRTNFPWSNPNRSQSESPLREITPVMGFTGKTLQFQRHLRWQLAPTALKVAGDATLGARNGVLGFYGREPVAKQSLADDEPSSGITALDNLIYALRDLGLLNARTEAVTSYQADDLVRRYLAGDAVTEWPEHAVLDVARRSTAANPTYVAEDPAFNRHPAVNFDNPVYRRTSKPLQELRGQNLLDETKHFIVVARHALPEFGYFEGLVNLSSGLVAADTATVFMSDSVGSGTWQMPAAVRYTMDGLNQTPNRQAGLPGPHVYRMTARDAWPVGKPVLGGPRDQDAARNWDNYSGNVAEVVAMDETWNEAAVASMERGLAFKYGIAQNPYSVELPARDFLVTQHNPMNGTFVFWDQDYSDSYTGKVYGRVINCPKPVIYIPFISIYIWFNFFSFRGSLLGTWGNLFGLSIDFEVEVSVMIGDFDGDGDFDTRIDVREELDVNVETRVGRFSLNNNLTWSMGNYSCYSGHKIVRIRHRTTREIVCVSGRPGWRYADTEVRVYSTKSDGSLLLEGTSPLWGDGTFGVRVQNPGHKVARVYEKSTGNLLGTTEWQEKALPRTTVYANDDSDVSAANRDKAHVLPSALTALAFCEMDLDNRYRARHILKTLAGVVNADGSLNDSYSAALPAKATRPANEVASVRGALMTIAAVLRYWGASGDSQFLGFAQNLANYLVGTQLAGGSIPTAPGQSTALTADNALAYTVLRDLATATGTTSYLTAANKIRDSLLANHWITATQRFGRGIADDREDLAADTYGGLFLLAIGDRVRARATIRHLKRFRVKNGQISAPHYSGTTGLIGYKPYAELGSTPYVNPPAVIDQPGSWLAVLFKMRFGEPVGDDVLALMRWQATVIYGPNAGGLYGAQFLHYTTTVTSGGYSLYARPNLHAAAWAYILTRGGRSLMGLDPLPAPSPTGLALAATFDRNAYRIVFRYAWTLSSNLKASAFEAVPEVSVNGGTTWAPASSGTISGTLENSRDAAVGTNGFSASWSVPVPSNTSSIYRVRLRLRNAAFGPWTTSPTVSLPAIT
jgi:hypothetical protein